MKKLFKYTLSALFPLVLLSCSVSSDIQPFNDVNISSKNTQGISFKFLKPEEIPEKVISQTLDEAQKLADKSSKDRDIDYFNLPKNPVGLELKSVDKSAYIINYIGTSKNTPDLNIEMRMFFNSIEMNHNFNYSGPVTLSSKKNYTSSDKSFLRNTVKTENNISFEILTGLPSESIVNAYERYLKNAEVILKELYRPKAITFEPDSVFVYAVLNGQNPDSFFFESHHNMVTLGERKYADLQIGVAITPETEIKASYMIVGFNPKTPLNTQPEYKFTKKGNVQIIQIGEF